MRTTKNKTVDYLDDLTEEHREDILREAVTLRKMQREHREDISRKTCKRLIGNNEFLLEIFQLLFENLQKTHWKKIRNSQIFLYHWISYHKNYYLCFEHVRCIMLSNLSHTN